MNQAQKTASIVATLVREENRIQMLPLYSGGNPEKMIAMENAVYSFMTKLCDSYKGGYWHMYQLSNGGFYMAPDGHSYDLFWAENYFEDSLSGDGAGIVACLLAFNYLTWKFQDERFDKLFWRLREFAYEHLEANKILKAID